MKRFVISVAAIALLGIYSCNNSGEKGSDSANTGDAVNSEASGYDLDPTDTIPAGGYTAGSASKLTADLVKKTLEHLYMSDLDSNYIDSFSRRFIFYEYDLNADGKKEIFVGLIGPYFCGSGGCTQLILDYQGNVVSHFTVTDYPVMIENTKTNGWNDLILYSGHNYHLIKFDGKTYPSNPSVEPSLSAPPADNLTKALNFMNEPYPWISF